jgi:hypothetical protein
MMVPLVGEILGVISIIKMVLLIALNFPKMANRGTIKAKARYQTYKMSAASDREKKGALSLTGKK